MNKKLKKLKKLVKNPNLFVKDFFINRLTVDDLTRIASKHDKLKISNDSDRTVQIDDIIKEHRGQENGDILWQKFKKRCQASPTNSAFDINFKDVLDYAQYTVFEVKKPSVKAAKYLINWIWKYHGPSHHATSLARKVFNTVIEDLTPEQEFHFRVIMTSMLVESSSLVRGAANLRYFDVNQYDSIWPRYSLALSEQMYLTGTVRTPFTELAADIMQKTRRYENIFPEILADNSKSICIVGNSPVEKGKKQGAEIDSHDIVIRFNNYSDDAEHAEDYGSKTNIWLRAGFHVDIWRRPAQAYDLVVFLGPDRRFHANFPSDIIEAVQQGAKVGFVPTQIYSELFTELGHRPSAGLLTLYWIRKIRGSFKENNVSTYGFSMADQSEFQSQQYFKNSLKKESYAHNWPEEAKFMKERILAD